MLSLIFFDILSFRNFYDNYIPNHSGLKRNISQASLTMSIINIFDLCQFQKQRNYLTQELMLVLEVMVVFASTHRAYNLCHVSYPGFHNSSV